MQGCVHITQQALRQISVYCAANSALQYLNLITGPMASRLAEQLVSGNLQQHANISTS